MPELKEGDIAPDFTLELDDGSVFTLSEKRGQPVVIYFYPQDDTGGCTDQNQEFSDRKKAFDHLGAYLIGISPDGVESHLKFRRKYGLSVPLASDPSRLAIEGFGLWQLKKLYGREFMGLVRTSYVLDGEGRIIRKIRATRIKGHAQKVLEALQDHLASPQ